MPIPHGYLVWLIFYFRVKIIDRMTCKLSLPPRELSGAAQQSLLNYQLLIIYFQF